VLVGDGITVGNIQNNCSGRSVDGRSGIDSQRDSLLKPPNIMIEAVWIGQQVP
jgi:hypothetical protein